MMKARNNENNFEHVEIQGFSLFQYVECPIGHGNPSPSLRIHRLVTPVGIVHLKVTKGLSVYKFSALYYKNQQKADGSPDIEKINAFSKVRLSMASRVADAVSILMDVGYFPEQAAFEIETDQFGDERLILKNWNVENIDVSLSDTFNLIALEAEHSGCAVNRRVKTGHIAA